MNGNLVIYIYRYARYLDWVDGINEKEGGLEKFSRAYEEYGTHTLSDGTIKCKEWAPGAEALYLTGTFSKILLEILCYLILIIIINFVNVNCMFTF